MADSLFDQALKLEGITGAAADFAKSIYHQESSSGTNTQTSNAGATGGMQITPSTFKSVADKGWNISDPLQNARAGIRYATKMFKASDSDPAIAAAGYYGGTGALMKAKKGIAVSDPRNPNAPTTLEYGQQVASRINAADPYLNDFMSRLKGTVAENKQKKIEAAKQAENLASEDDLSSFMQTIAPKPAVQQEAQPTTLLGDIGQGVKKFGKSIVGDGGAVDLITGLPKAAYGIGEAIVGGGAHMAAMIPEGLYGIASGVSNMLPQAIGGGGGGFGEGYTQGSQQVKNIAENIIPAPYTNAGQAVQQVMGAPAAELHRGGGAIGQGVENLTGSATLGGLAAAGTETLGNALMLGLPLKGKVAPEIAAAERTRQQIVSNPPIERAAPQAAEVAPIVEPVAPRTPTETMNADIAAYQAERQPLAATPEGLAAQAETMSAPAVEVGKPAVHVSNGVETPVVVKNIEQQAGSDGKTYARVEINGKDSFIPADELVATIDSTRPVEPMTAAETVNVPKAGELPLQELASKARASSESLFGKAAARDTLAEQVAPNPKVVTAAERLGVMEDLQPEHVTTNQSYRELAQAIKSYTGSALGAAEKERLATVAAKADNIIADIGATKDISSLSQRIKDSMHSTIEELKASASSMYDSLREKIQQTDQVSAPETMAFIDERAKNMAGAQYVTKYEKMVQAKLSDKAKPTYARLDDVRRELTAAKYKKEGTFGEADSWIIDQLLNRLNKDQRTAIEAVAKRNGLDSKALIADFDLAQQTSAVYKDVQSDMVKLFGKQLDGNIASALKNGVAGLARGDIKTFANLIKSVPESMRSEVVANGLAYAFDKNLGAINYNTFANFWNGIKQQGEANKLLKQYLPEQSYKALDDLGIVSESIAKALKENIQTGKINSVTETLKDADTMIGKLYEKAKAGAVGAVGTEAISTVAGFPGAGIAIGAVLALAKDKPPIHIAVERVIGSKEFRDAVLAKSKMEALRGQK